MRKQISFALIIFVLFYLSISYASENLADKEVASSSKDVDSIPRVTHAVDPNFSFNSKIGTKSDDLLEGVNEGRVLIKLIVTKDGKVRAPEVVESTPPKVFDEYALKTVMEYRFKPAMKNGRPVDFIVKLPVEFKIPQNKSSYTAYKVRVNGRKYFQLKEFDKAIEAYTEAIKIDKDYSPYFVDRGKTYMEMGDYKKAILDINKAIDLTPDDSSYYKARSEAYMKLEDTNNMCLDLKKACELGDCSGFDQSKEAGKCKG